MKQEVIIKVFSKIDIEPYELVDGYLTHTKFYKSVRKKFDTIGDKLNDIVPDSLEDIAFRLIISELWRGDNHGWINMETIREKLVDKLENIERTDLIKLIKYYGVVENEYEYIEEENFYFKSKTDDELLNFTTIVNIATLLLTMDLEIEIEKTKRILKHYIKPRFWYQVYDINQDDDEKERIDAIVDSVLR